LYTYDNITEYNQHKLVNIIQQLQKAKEKTCALSVALWYSKQELCWRDRCRSSYV